MRVAVVGAGVAGLAAAHELARSGGVQVTLYEKEHHLGGDARTVAVDDDGGAGHVNLDLSFMVFNRVTSPNMMEWFEGLGVEIERSDMSFSVSALQDRNGSRFEWGSRNGISGLLAQKGNWLSPSFWRMILEIFEFKNHALKYLEDHERNPDLDSSETLGHFINVHGYSKLLQDAYLIPMCACIWPCPSQGVLGFPASFVLSYCRDNHLLELFGRPQWHTVKERSESYVNKVREELESMGCQIKTSCEVKSVSSLEGGYRVLEVGGSEEMYNQIIFSVHAPDALKALGDEATRDELRILGAFRYTKSDVYLHQDGSFMPRSLSAWSARNFLGTTSRGVCVTYWLNVLQNIGSARPFLVTLNPTTVPDHVLHKWRTSHLNPSVAAAKASLDLRHIQGNRGLWFCGSYQGYGFHEDGVKAGKSSAAGLLGKKCDILVNPKVMVPSWTEAGARLLVTRFLDQYISIGSLSLIEEGGSTFSFGKACRKCHQEAILG
ncbi:unnamed protein product [Urochloa humidicola]